jgi:MFS family permease
LPVGITSDRMSIAKILAFGLALAAINRLGFLLTRRFTWFCLYALLGSFGARFYGTAIQALFFKLSGTENKRQAGWYMLSHFTSSGVGMILGGWLIQRFDFRTAFVCGLVGNLLLMVFAAQLPKNDCATLEIAEYKRSILRPRVLLLTAVFFLSSLHWGAEHTSYVPFLKYTLGLSLFGASLYGGVGMVFVGAGTVLGAKLLQWRLVKDLPGLLWLGFALAGSFHMLMCVPEVWASFLFRCLHELGDGFVFLVYYQGIAKVFKLDRIGGCAAFVSLWTAVGTMVGSLLFGWVGGRFGYRWPLILSGALLVLVPLLRPLLAGLEEPGTSKPAVDLPAAE